jgi:putative transposase
MDALPRWRLFYHVVWTTHRRQPILTGRVEQATHAAIRNIAERHGYIIHAVGGVDDHVHVAVSIPPAISVSTAVGRLKGGSSKLVNERPDIPMEMNLQWQTEFSVTSFSNADLDAVRRYIDNQRTRHARDRLNPRLEPGD